MTDAFSVHSIPAADLSYMLTVIPDLLSGHQTLISITMNQISDKWSFQDNPRAELLTL